MVSSSLNGTPFAVAPAPFTPIASSNPGGSLAPTDAVSASNVSTIRYPLTLEPQSLAIDTLRGRPYGGGAIKITRTISSDEAFTRVHFEYPSDGLRITGMMNIPQGIGPFPVVILNHGYFKPSEYKTGDGTNRAADNFARGGYLTLASDYRCYAGSQCGSNPLYVGFAVDVLNLIASLDSLSYADTQRIGMWGHSMGGGITLRVIAVSNRVKVAAVYGALTGDDEIHYCWLRGCKTPAPPNNKLTEIDQDFLTGMPVPDYVIGTPTPVPTLVDPLARLREIFVKSSPSRYYGYVTAPVVIHHGEADDIVPIQWSVDLSNALGSLGKPAFLFTYPGEGHVFAGWNWQLFMARTLSIFNDYINPRETPITAERRVLKHEQSISDLTY